MLRGGQVNFGDKAKETWVETGSAKSAKDSRAQEKARKRGINSSPNPVLRNVVIVSLEMGVPCF